MRIDLGSGNEVYGDIGYDINFTSHTKHDKKTYDYIASWGFHYNPDPVKLYLDLNGDLSLLENDDEHYYLMMHTMEHLLRPYDVVRRILSMNNTLQLTIVVPNAINNYRSDINDYTHLYSWTEYSLKNFAEHLIIDTGFKYYEVENIGNGDLGLTFVKIWHKW